MASLRSTGGLTKYLDKIGNTAKGQPKVKIGFLAGATYPSGLSVAQVASWNEFGDPAHNRPARPFFRQMIAAKKSTWGDAIALQLKATGFDVPATLDRVGQGIGGQLAQSIRDFTDPPLAPSTVAKKGFAKPLVDTAVMLRSIDHEVEN